MFTGSGNRDMDIMILGPPFHPLYLPITSPHVFCHLPISIPVSIFASCDLFSILTYSWNTTLFLPPTLLLYSFPLYHGFQSPSWSHPSVAHQVHVQPLVRYLPPFKPVLAVLNFSLLKYNPILSLAFPQVTSSWVLSFDLWLTHFSPFKSQFNYYFLNISYYLFVELSFFSGREANQTPSMSLLCPQLLDAYLNKYFIHRWWIHEEIYPSHFFKNLSNVKDGNLVKLMTNLAAWNFKPNENMTPAK